MTTSSDPPETGAAGPSGPDRGRAWLATLFADHHAQVRRYAARRVGPDDADDVTSEVFATAWRRRDDVPETVLPWLYNVAAHHVQRSRRGEARRGRLASRAFSLVGRDRSDSGEFADVDTALDADARVRSILDKLTPDDAEILRLSAWEELDPADIAIVLGCSAGAARVRLHRARRRAERLLTRIDEQHGDERRAGTEGPFTAPPHPESPTSRTASARPHHRITCQGES